MKKRHSKWKILVGIIMIFLCVFLVFLAIIPFQIMGDIDNYRIDVEVVSPNNFGLIPKDVILRTQDELNIAAWEVEITNPKAIVILLSGTENPSVTAFWGYAKMLSDNGYASLLIEMRGHGYSEGSISLGYKEYLDVKAGVEYIKNNEKYKNLPIIVWGTSMGGTVAINSIGEIQEIDGLISVSAFSSWPDVFYDNMKAMGIPTFFASLEKPFVTIYLGFKLGFNNLKINPKKEIKKSNGRPALLMHSTEDSQVPYANFERIAKVVNNDIGKNIKVFIREGDEHFICYDQYSSNPTEDVEFSTVVLNFLNGF